MKVTHVPRPYWEKWHNPQTDKDENFVELARISTQDTRGPWHNFYFFVAVSKDNVHMGRAMYNKLKKDEEWLVEKI